MSLPSTLGDGPEIFVSWDGTAAFDGPDDDVSGDVDGEAFLVLSEGRDGVQQLSPPRVNDGGFELFNEDGRYSQERADSPVYQRVEPTKPVYYQATHGDEGVYDEDADYDEPLYYDGAAAFALGRHIIDEIDERTELGDYRVKIDTIGYETILTRGAVTVPVMVAPRVDQCFTALLDAVSWPADKRRIAVADTTLLYWWCDERNPWAAMLELLAAEGPGTFGVDREGVFYFENRNFRTTASRASSSQATFGATANGGLWFTALKPINPFKNIFNRATFTTRRRTTGTPGTVIWTYGADLTFSASQARTLIARPSDGNPFLSAITPVSPTDFTVSGGTVSVSLSASSGLVAVITITATSGTPTVSGLQLRATPLTVVGETTVENTVDASDSIAHYSPIPGQNIPLTLSIGGWPEIDPAQAEGVCDAWVLRQQSPRPQISFILRNADGEHLEQILSRRVSDRVTLTHEQSGLNADVWINQMSLSIGGHRGAKIALTIGAEKCDSLTGALWDVAEWDDPSSLWGV